jgi:hypothetical protein
LVWGCSPVQQVISNLLTNALQFTPEHGSVEVRLDHIDDRARIVVRDSGIGISPDLLPRIFDRFEQGDIRRPGRIVALGSASPSSSIWWSNTAVRSAPPAAVRDVVRPSRLHFRSSVPVSHRTTGRDRLSSNTRQRLVSARSWSMMKRTGARHDEDAGNVE